MFKAFVVVSFVALMSLSAHAQTSRDTDDLVERAAMVAEIKALRGENEGLKAKVDAQSSQIDTLKQLNVVQEARIADLKESIKLRSEASDVSEKIEVVYKDRVAELKAENERLRKENDGLRKSRERRTLLALIAGVVAGAFGF